MNQTVLQHVVEELQGVLTARFFGKIYQLGPVSFAIDFGLRGEFLFISVDPASPRLYLIRRRTKDLEKQSVALSAFGQMMRSRLSGAHALDVSRDPLDRIVRLTFRVDDESGAIIFRRLVVQLTGRTADLFLLDELNRIVTVLRDHAQIRIHKTYAPPPPPQKEPSEVLQVGPGPPSIQLDTHFTHLDETKVFDTRAKSLRSKLTKSI